MVRQTPSKLSLETIEEAAEAHALRTVEDGELRYLRFADDFHRIPRGTIVIDGRTLPVYPSIGRIFALRAGIESTFDGPFHVEEKLDGYNVRVALHKDRLLCFTRGGFLCPFTEERLPDLVDLRPFFAEHPQLVVCAELAGPDNPYIETHQPGVAEDLAFFAFDILDPETCGFLPLAERDALFAAFAIKRAPQLGVYRASDWADIAEAVRRLDALGAEGIVLKPPAQGLRVKYVTPRINILDFATDAALLAELPGEFFTSRLQRLAIGMLELGMPCDARVYEQIGRALLPGFLRSVECVQRHGQVYKDFRVRLRREETVDKLLAHLNRASRSIRVQELSRRREGDYLIVQLRKIFNQSTSRLKTMLGGNHTFD